MELKEQLEEIRSGLEQKTDAKYSELEKRLEEIATKINTPEFKSQEDTEDKEVAELRSMFFDGIRQKNIDSYKSKAKDIMKSQGYDERALTGGSTTGGFMVPPDFQTKIITSVGQKNVLRLNGNVGRTSSDTVIFGTMADIAAAWGNTPPVVEPSGDQVESSAKTLSVTVKIHNHILEDSEADIEAEIQRLAVKAFTKAEREAMTNQVANAVEGLLPTVVAADSSAYSIDTGAAGSLGADDKAVIEFLNSIKFALDEEDADNAKWMMNRKTLGSLASIYHPNGAPIYDSASNKLLGYEVITNASMDDISVATSTTHPIVFGNFDEYSIKDRKTMTLKVSDHTYMNENKLALFFETRIATKVTRPDAFRVVEVTTA